MIQSVVPACWASTTVSPPSRTVKVPLYPPSNVRSLLEITTSSGYAPAWIFNVSPLVAALTAPWMESANPPLFRRTMPIAAVVNPVAIPAVTHAEMMRFFILSHPSFHPL